MCARLVSHRLIALFGITSSLVTLALLLSACPGKVTPQYDPCEQDTDCKAGYICRGGRCEQVNDDTCQADGDCKDGKLCIRSKCQNVICQDERDCAAGEECKGGYCEKKATETTTEGGTSDGGSEPTPQPDITADKDTTADKGPPAFCEPNRDGKIDRNEMLFKIGTSVTYREAGSNNSPVVVDLTGTKDANGETTWFFDKPVPSSTKVVDELLSMSGTWYESKFSGATYTAILDRSLSFFGIFQTTNEALLLMGVASETSAALTKTELKYDKPIELFRFPLAVGSKWTASGTASGTLSGVPFVRMSETYVFEVDAKGKAKTLLGEFPVVRLKLNLTQQQTSPTFLRRTSISYYFLSECYGIIARIDSKTYESNENFTQAARIKLLSD